MKKVIISDEYNEIDLKPSALLHEYFHLIKKDIVDFFIKNKH